MKKRSLGDLIKKLVETAQEKNMKKLEEKINRNIEIKIQKMKTNIINDLSGVSKGIKSGGYSEINRTISKNNELIDKANSEIESIKNLMKESEHLHELLKKTNIKDLIRNMEVLRTRSQWIEKRLEKYSLKPVLDKIQDLEAKIDSVMLSSPLVVE